MKQGIILGLGVGIGITVATTLLQAALYFLMFFM